MLTGKNLKKQFQQCKRLFGAWTAFSDPSIAELLASVIKPDFIAIDMEHSTLSLEAAQRIIMAIQSKGIQALPRVSSHDKEEISKLLDAGADGVIVPAVNNKAELLAIIKAVKYPPVGERGYGIYRAQLYGENFSTYSKHWNQDSILLLIIETKEGMENINELLSNDYVDGILIGQYDLSGSLGIPGELQDPKLQNAVQTILNSCKKHNKSCGLLLGSPDKLGLEAASEKANFIILSTDVLMLANAARSIRKLIDEI